MAKQYDKDDSEDEFNHIVETHDQFLERKADEKAYAAATRRARFYLTGAAWFCLVLALACVVGGNHITAAMNLIFSIVSFKAAFTNFARY